MNRWREKAWKEYIADIDFMDLVGEFDNPLKASELLSKGNVQFGGIGLKNVERRLELLYNGRHELQIKEDDHLFKVDLKIKI